MRAVVDNPDRVRLLAGDHVFDQSAPMPLVMRALLIELARGDGRNERVGVDLSVRVMQRDTDFDATVLERVNVRHMLQPCQLVVAIGPDVDQQLEMWEGQTSKRGGRVLRSEEHT